MDGQAKTYDQNDTKCIAAGIGWLLGMWTYREAVSMCLSTVTLNHDQKCTDAAEIIGRQRALGTPPTETAKLVLQEFADITFERECCTCHGMGEGICPICDGTGRGFFEGCTGCRGSGDIRCQDCGGSGKEIIDDIHYFD